MTINIKLFSILALMVTFNLSAGYPPYGSHASDKWQIWAYTSAAPDFIGDFATVIGADGSVIREGTNGWRCEAFMQRLHAQTKILWHGQMHTRLELFLTWKEMDGCG